jgi:hypothetical protein
MLFAAGLVSTIAAEVTLPTLSPAKAIAPPAIDGRLDDACWQHAQPVKQFWTVDGSTLIDDAIWAKVSYDQDKLYIACHMPASPDVAWPQGSTIRDEGVWFSPNVQIFIQPTRASGYYVFTLNSHNTQEDLKDFVTVWNCHWPSAVHINREESYWQVEMAIPFSAFDLSENPTERWRFNLTCSHVPLSDGKGYVLTWAPTFGNFHAPKLFGNLILKDNKWAIRECELEISSRPGEAGSFEVELKSRTKNKLDKGKVAVAMTSPSGQVEEKVESVKLTDSTQSLSVKMPATEEGTHTFRARLATRDGLVLAERETSADTPPSFDLWLDKSLYTREKTARLTAASWRSDMAGKKCKIVIADGQAKSQGKPHYGKFDKTFRFSKQINLESLEVGDYTVSLYPAKGENPDAYAQCRLRKLKPEPGTVSSNQRGVIEIDQKPFFPFGMYYIQNFLDKEGLLEEYVQAGFNTIVWEWTTAEGYIKALEKMKPYGIHLITSVQNEPSVRDLQERWWKAKGEEKRKLEQAIYKQVGIVVKKVAGSHPSNLLGWYIQDEPNSELLPYVTRASRIVQGIDLRRPTLVVPCHTVVFKQYAPVVDLLAPDAYPGFPDGPITKVSDFIDTARKTVKGRKPVVIVLQAFGEHGGPKTLLPTPAELRCMTYLSLVHEARGVIYFSYSYNGPMREAHPAQWQELKNLAGEVRDLGPILPETAGNVVLTQSDGTSQVHTRVIRHDDRATILAVNTLRTPIKNVQWKTTGLKTGSLEVMGEDRRLKVKSGKFDDDFEPLAVHLYRQKIE